jgi:conjugative relaxase-like TrwC/TraI family protein
MTLHKLSAGNGYTYLTRHVARHDGPAVGYDSLGAYYSERGEAPGVWLGRGLAGLDAGPAVGDRVGEAQMVALFGHGHHPNNPAVPLGRSFTVRSGGPGFGRALAQRIAEHNTAAGKPPAAPVDPAVRARLRSELGTEWFVGEHGRDPDARELTDYLATVGRRGGSSVAGYDLTFSPVKSVSALWATADPEVAAQVEAAHDAAVTDVIGWLEDTATFTRLGRNGVRQVDVRGLLAVAFTHRDSRTGDPDLHTHVAISNKVQTTDGRWRALDGRVLHKTAVAASERYNTRLEAQLVDRLGVTFADRPAERGKRPVREIVGIDPDLLEVWSSRRQEITDRQTQLAAEFTRTHGRTPDAGETHDLFAQANLMTRPAKPGPRSLAEQRATWHADAVSVLGDDRAVEMMLDAVTGRDRAAVLRSIPADWPRFAARRAVLTVSASRATWQSCHVRAEVERLARTEGIPLTDLDAMVQAAVEVALSPAVSIRLGGDHDGITEPASLRRRDGSSVFTVAGAQFYTSPDILAAESRLLAAAAREDGRRVPDGLIELSLLEVRLAGRALNPGQEQMVRDLATSGRRVQLALAAAGTGKTTALGALAAAWRENGGNIIGLAPSAVAAAELRAAVGGTTDTIAKLLHGVDTGRLVSGLAGIDSATLVIIDEAGMAGTFDLDRTISHVLHAGGSVRFVGDTRQLAAVASGGILRDIARSHPVATLDIPVRFTDPVEGHASLALRVGDPVALGYYLDHNRIHGGDRTTTVEEAFGAWSADRAAGLDVVLLAATNDTVRDLNTRARAHRLTEQPPQWEVRLHDGTRASAGDLIVTRRNDRRLPVTATDWVKNGDRWTIEALRDDGSIMARHLASRRTVDLPATYVRRHVELGYATTIHLAQGRTAHTCHTVLTGRENRHDLYVAMTRGRHANHVYLDTAAPGPDDATTPAAIRPPTSIETLEAILARDSDRASATSQHQADLDPATQLHRAADRYTDVVSIVADGQPASGARPLPWLPAIPDILDDDWADYLHQRSRLVTTAAARISVDALPNQPWATALLAADPVLARDVAVWRAATGTNPDHPDPCGPLECPAPGYRRALTDRVHAALDRHSDPAERWRALVSDIDPRLTVNPGWPWLARAITQAADTGYDVRTRLPHLIHGDRPLPAEHAARSLVYRLATDCPESVPPPRPIPYREPDDDRKRRDQQAADAGRRHHEHAERTRGRSR